MSSLDGGRFVKCPKLFEFISSSGGKGVRLKEWNMLILETVCGLDDAEAKALLGHVKRLTAAKESDSALTGDCEICCDRAKEVVLVPCGHTFCRQCANKVMRGGKRCPFCRKAIAQTMKVF